MADLSNDTLQAQREGGQIPMNDEQAIAFMLGSIAWAEECQNIHRPGGPRLVTPHYVLVPSRFDQHHRHHREARALADELGKHGGLLLWGDTGDEEWALVNDEAYRTGLIVLWAGTRNRVRWCRFVAETLEAER